MDSRKVASELKGRTAGLRRTVGLSGDFPLQEQTVAAVGRGLVCGSKKGGTAFIRPLYEKTHAEGFLYDRKFCLIENFVLYDKNGPLQKLMEVIYERTGKDLQSRRD